ncbi:MAG: hypothetical protein HZC47_08990 [Methanobacterium sp.]|uniref:hypothetical protein n=1 Tax=Methanobacterium sp. TaxID=2164 RepID=UPI003D64BDEB|nr:hypothetical protein [Methanobacterium sp.]
MNSDGISYITIAQKYINGDFINAINGYWGPLLSWLLIPLLQFSSSPQSSVYLMKILSLITGFFTIIGIRLLINNFEIEKTIKTAIVFSLIPTILYFSFFITTPDLLITCTIVYYLYFIFSPNYCNNLLMGILCGLSGALSYLSKSYALAFFLTHFIIFNLFFYFQSENKKKHATILKNLFLGLLIFFTVSGLWIGLISDKYDKLTIGTAGEYNYNFVGPESNGHYDYYMGLVKPPNESAVSSWEDPSYFKMESWSPFESWDYLKFQMKIILDNILKIINIFELFSIFSIIIIITAIILLFKSGSNTLDKNKIIYLLTTILLYSGGYSLIFVETRYLWLIDILLLITGGYVLSLLFKMNFLNKTQKNILIVFLILSFIITPISGLIQDLNAGEKIYDLSVNLKKDNNLHGNLASNKNWVISNSIAFYTGTKYFGMTKKTDDYTKLKTEIEENNINYYMVWGESNENFYLSKFYKEMTNGTIKGLKIYSITT